jgi:transcription elongation factor Elf1
MSSEKKLREAEGFLWECPTCGSLNLGEVTFWKTNRFKCVNCENVVEVFYGE